MLSDGPKCREDLIKVGVFTSLQRLGQGSLQGLAHHSGDLLLSLDSELCEEGAHDKLPGLDVSLDVDRGGEPCALLGRSPWQDLTTTNSSAEQAGRRGRGRSSGGKNWVFTFRPIWAQSVLIGWHL